jgi:hypothetical protein
MLAEKQQKIGDPIVNYAHACKGSPMFWVAPWSLLNGKQTTCGFREDSS